MELSINMFQWDNLPETCDERFLELALFCNGRAVFFKDEILGHLALRCMDSGYYDIYGTPKQRTAYSYNGYSNMLSDKDSVIIYDNRLRNVSMPIIELFALRLYEIERTMDVNIKNLKTPLVIVAPETQRLTWKNLMKDFQGNEPLIFGSKDLDTTAVKVLNTEATLIADKLMTLKNQIWGEALTYLGIEHVDFEKRERLVNTEVTFSLGATIAQRYTKLNERKTACKKINEMFGLNIDVKFREMEYDFKSFENGDEENGEIHNGTEDIT